MLTGQPLHRVVRGLGVLLLFVGLNATVACAVQRAGTPTEADLGITPTAVPTATPKATPTPTPEPTPAPLDYDVLFDKQQTPDVVANWEVPIAHCEAVGPADTDSSSADLFVPRGVSAIRCVDGDAADRPTGVVQAVADARVVQIGYLDVEPDDLEALEPIEQDTDASAAQWVDGGLLGNHIVLDIDLAAHAEVDPPPSAAERDDPTADATASPRAAPNRTGDPELDETPEPATTNPRPTTSASDSDATDNEGATSIQVVYGGMDGDFDHLKLGQRVNAGDILGNTGNDGGLLFGVWVDGVRQDDATPIATKAPPANTQRRIATQLAKEILPPTAPECGLVTSQGRIPGAPREYRHGFHQGIDFVCTGDDNEVTAVAAGTVVYLIDDYQDATVDDRNALLGRAIPAGNTPYWTLTMLYGNVVVIDHGQIEDVGRVFTISAHLDSVDDDIELGSTVKQDQVIGIVGTTGTNASAEGVPHEDDPGQHLHWELFIDNWYLGQGLTPPEVQETIVIAVCEDGSPDCE